MKTTEVRALIREVLDSLHKPYSPHVIDEVFSAIEQKPEWRARYDILSSSLGRDVVNNWGGRWVGVALGKVGEQQVPSKLSTLIGSYSVLDTDIKTSIKNPSETDALQLMAEYYKLHKEELPKNTRDYRDEIVKIIMEGIPPKDAFAMALRGDA